MCCGKPEGLLELLQASLGCEVSSVQVGLYLYFFPSEPFKFCLFYIFELLGYEAFEALVVCFGKMLLTILVSMILSSTLLT
jgi:hypothetical protein